VTTRGASASELRRRPKGAAYSQRQLDEALSGTLTLRNTRRGSAARKAVTRAAYAKRAERAEREGDSRAQGRGHPARGEPLRSQEQIEWSSIVTTSGIVDLRTTSRSEARRVGQHLADTRALLEGRKSEREFARRWGRRNRSAGRYQLEADPDVVLALVFAGGPGPVLRYRRVEPAA
jgi:hypothetical protein